MFNRITQNVQSSHVILTPQNQGLSRIGLIVRLSNLRVEHPNVMQRKKEKNTTQTIR